MVKTNARHQIFISSTFKDLGKERQSMFEATYRMGHIPIGMEGFTASNLSQWSYIENRIKESDYFAVVVAKRLGSLMPDGTGRSITEAEYDLAMSLNKPVLRFLLSESAAWPLDADHQEKDPESQIRLSAFTRRLSSATLCGFWSDAHSLSAAYSAALSSAIREDPRGGLYPVDMHPALEKMHISSIDSESNSADHQSILASPGLVTIILNDGHHFIPKYQNEIRERVRSGRLTRVLLVHPKSRGIKLVAKKSDKKLTRQVADIMGSVALLKNIAQEGKSPELLQVRGHHCVNNYSATLSDEAAIISLYFTFVRSSELTTMKLTAGPGSLHQKYMDDVDRLWREVEGENGADLFDLV